MSKQPVKLAPSRIRREPTLTISQRGMRAKIWSESPVWEIRLAIAGIIFFAVAISALIIDVGQLFPG